VNTSRDLLENRKKGRKLLRENRKERRKKKEEKKREKKRHLCREANIKKASELWEYIRGRHVCYSRNNWKRSDIA